MSLRTPETFKKYEEARKNAPPGCPLCRAKDINVIKDFTYWVIIPNDFPYDKIAKENNMLTLKRHADLDQMTAEEAAELILIKSQTLPTLPYSTLYENLPRQQSVKGHYHIHLIVLKDEFADMPA